MLASMNTTLATLRNTTTAETNSQQGDRQNSSVTTSASSNLTDWSNVSEYNQNNPEVQNDSYSYTYNYSNSFIYYLLLLLVLVAAIVCITVVMQKRNGLLRRAVAQRITAPRPAANACGSSNSTNNNSNDNNNSQMGPEVLDSPPVYDGIILPSFMAKQSLPNIQESAQGASSSTPAAVSTLTMATDTSSDIELNNMAINRSRGLSPPSVSATRMHMYNQ